MKLEKIRQSAWISMPLLLITSIIIFINGIMEKEVVEILSSVVTFGISIWGIRVLIYSSSMERNLKDYVISESDISNKSHEQLIKFQQLERIYMQTQNHCEELGRTFCSLGFKGASPEYCIGRMIEDAILRTNSQEKQRKADHYLKSYCGCSFEELVERIRDN